MPTYTFKDINTQEVLEYVIKMSEYDDFVQKNPNLQRYFDSESTVNIVGGLGGIRTDAGWKEVVSKVAALLN